MVGKIHNLEHRPSRFLDRIRWAVRWTKQVAPTYVVNFIFQRLFRLNSDCPWSVHFTSRVMHPERIRVHPSSQKSFAFSGGCYVQGTNGIEIGEGTLFAYGVKIISANHDLQDLGQARKDTPIRIGRHCWLAANAVVLPGVELGDGVVVGAGCVVTKSFPAGAVVAGVPGRIIGDRSRPDS